MRELVLVIHSLLYFTGGCNIVHIAVEQDDPAALISWQVCEIEWVFVVCFICCLPQVEDSIDVQELFVVRNKDGNTPLMLAVERGREACVAAICEPLAALSEKQVL